MNFENSNYNPKDYDEYSSYEINEYLGDGVNVVNKNGEVIPNPELMDEVSRIKVEDENRKEQESGREDQIDYLANQDDLDEVRGGKPELSSLPLSEYKTKQVELEGLENLSDERRRAGKDKTESSDYREGASIGVARMRDLSKRVLRLLNELSQTNARLGEAAYIRVSNNDSKDEADRMRSNAEARMPELEKSVDNIINKLVNVEGLREAGFSKEFIKDAKEKMVGFVYGNYGLGSNVANATKRNGEIKRIEKTEELPKIKKVTKTKKH